LAKLSPADPSIPLSATQQFLRHTLELQIKVAKINWEPTMLEVKDLVTSFGSVIALDGVSFTAQESKITTVIGANGAGKSTLLRTISGLEHPASGSITWSGKSLIGMRAEDIVRDGIAHVPEGHAVISELSVEENISMGSLFRRRKFKADVLAAQDEMFELFPRLKERRKQLAGTLSGGERQMLAISRALVSRPKLLLLDEPSLGLAPLVVEQIIDSINILCRTTGLTVLLVEQNANTALGVADHGVLLALGKVVADRPAAELRADANLRAAYLGY
jgi:branched-chain amino acid transport system ATP-binding protein